MNNSEALSSFLTKEKKALLICEIMCQLCREKQNLGNFINNCNFKNYCKLRILRWLEEDLKEKFAINEELEKLKENL